MGFSTESIFRLSCDCCGMSAGSFADREVLWCAAQAAGWTRTADRYWCFQCGPPEHDRTRCRVLDKHAITGELTTAEPPFLISLSCSCGNWGITSTPQDRAADEALHHIAVQLRQAAGFGQEEVD